MLVSILWAPTAISIAFSNMDIYILLGIVFFLILENPRIYNLLIFGLFHLLLSNFHNQ